MPIAADDGKNEWLIRRQLCTRGVGRYSDCTYEVWLGSSAYAPDFGVLAQALIICREHLEVYSAHSCYFGDVDGEYTPAHQAQSEHDGDVTVIISDPSDNPTALCRCGHSRDRHTRKGCDEGWFGDDVDEVARCQCKTSISTHASLTIKVDLSHAAWRVCCDDSANCRYRLFPNAEVDHESPDLIISCAEHGKRVTIRQHREMYDSLNFAPVSFVDPDENSSDLCECRHPRATHTPQCSSFWRNSQGGAHLQCGCVTFIPWAIEDDDRDAASFFDDGLNLP